MLVAQSLALAFMVVRYAFVTMYVTITCVAYIRRRSATGFSKVILVNNTSLLIVLQVLDEVLRERFPLFLEHKYFDRWMVKALHKGLHDRPVRLSELPRSVVAQRYIQNIRHSVRSLFVLGTERQQGND